jgi:hypothetical protein
MMMSDAMMSANVAHVPKNIKLNFNRELYSGRHGIA